MTNNWKMNFSTEIIYQSTWKIKFLHSTLLRVEFFLEALISLVLRLMFNLVLVFLAVHAYRRSRSSGYNLQGLSNQVFKTWQIPFIFSLFETEAMKLVSCAQYQQNFVRSEDRISCSVNFRLRRWNIFIVSLWKSIARCFESIISFRSCAVFRTIFIMI
jgi:hypothetical protein